MANQNAKGWRRIVRACGFSIQGFRACYAEEEAFRQEVWALIPLLPLGLWLGETPLERAVLVGALLMVPIVELLNSAIEANVDRVGLEHHELSGRAKDIASAAVLLSVVFALSVWGLILIPKWSSVQPPQGVAPYGIGQGWNQLNRNSERGCAIHDGHLKDRAHVCPPTY